MKSFTNSEVAKLLRSVAAAFIIKNTGNIFQIRAYENAADSIEQGTTEIFDLWQEGKLSQVPNLGTNIQNYLNELFIKGKVSHFEEVKKGIPNVVFELLDIPGIGPKTALKLSEMGVLDREDLKKKIKNNELQEKGFSPKVAQNILTGFLQITRKGNRMLLPYAYSHADRILAYLRQCPDVIKVHVLGSLRRMAATVGDLDFAVSSNNPENVVKYFCRMPQSARIIDQGQTKASVALQSGLQADLLVGSPESYGALLQHFTGSKAHNIHLRTLAGKIGLSLSEYGVKKAGKLIKTETEEQFYKLLGMQVPLPEIREDTGEIEAALAHKLPDLVKIEDIKGDLHLHSNYPFPSPSHAPGVDLIEEIIEKAKSLNYEFVGIADHPPGVTRLSSLQITESIKKRTKVIQNIKQSTKSIHILNSLEIDILADGTLSVPDSVLESLDFCIAGIHSVHHAPKEEMTKRIIGAMLNPYVDIISHPTNRLINERESSDADWEEIFKACVKYNKILEINAHPIRLDLRDDLVRSALKYGVKFIINTDAHEVTQMDNMKYGVAVARRGWCTKQDIINTWDWKKFAEWFKIKT
jgi:DNA polymerase (family X)